MKRLIDRVSSMRLGNAKKLPSVRETQVSTSGRAHHHRGEDNRYPHDPSTKPFLHNPALAFHHLLSASPEEYNDSRTTILRHLLSADHSFFAHQVSPDELQPEARSRFQQFLALVAMQDRAKHAQPLPPDQCCQNLADLLGERGFPKEPPFSSLPKDLFAAGESRKDLWDLSVLAKALNTSVERTEELVALTLEKVASLCFQKTKTGHLLFSPDILPFLQETRRADVERRHHQGDFALLLRRIQRAIPHLDTEAAHVLAQDFLEKIATRFPELLHKNFARRTLRDPFPQYFSIPLLNIIQDLALMMYQKGIPSVADIPDAVFQESLAPLSKK